MEIGMRSRDAPTENGMFVNVTGSETNWSEEDPNDEDLVELLTVLGPEGP